MMILLYDGDPDSFSFFSDLLQALSPVLRLLNFAEIWFDHIGFLLSDLLRKKLSQRTVALHFDHSIDHSIVAGRF
jgi:hypothetical protein